jgi:hypothetical protein
MSNRRPRSGLAVLLSAVMALTAVHGREETARRASLATIEGIVSAVETVSGEGGGAVTAARISVEKPEPREMSILLAPEDALRQIGFEIEAGDRVRARIFLSAEDPAPVHKVLNLSRGMMVRLRTLMRIPVWDSKGQWQGGPCRNRQGWGATSESRHREQGGRRR